MRVRVSVGVEQVIARGVVYQGDFHPPGDAATGEWFAVLSISHRCGCGEECVDWRGSALYPSPREAIRHLLADLDADGGFPVRDLFEAGRQQIDAQIESVLKAGDTMSPEIHQLLEDCRREFHQLGGLIAADGVAPEETFPLSFTVILKRLDDALNAQTAPYAERPCCHAGCSRLGVEESHASPGTWYCLPHWREAINEGNPGRRG